LCIGQTLSAQYVYTIKADSVKITNSCDTAELILENHTQNVPGFLYNKGRGRTEFRRGVIKVSDSIYVVGADTIKTMLPGLSWLLNGNSGTNATNNFVGTTDAADLAFRTNNTEAARFNNSTGNLLLGSTVDNGAKLQVYGKQAIYGNADVTQLLVKLPASPSIVTPIVQIQDNTGASLFDMRLDSLDVSLGTDAGVSNNAPNYNVAIGKRALYSNTTGQFNFAAGPYCLTNNITGSNNCAIGGGAPALYANTTGSGNIAVGTNALSHNTTGSWNTAIGRNTLTNTIDASYNVAVGNAPLYYNVHGSENVAVGIGALGALISQTSSSQNVAIGGRAAMNRQIGINNIFIGYRTNVDAPAGDSNTIIGAWTNLYGGTRNIMLGASSYAAGVTNTTVIGQQMNCTVSNVVALGRADQNTIIGVTSGFTDNGARLQVNGSQTTSSNIGVGGITSMTAKVHIAASDGTAGTAPLKLTAGTVLSTPEDGAIEYDGTNYYVTQSTTRYTLTKTLSGQITTNFGGPSLSAFNSVTTTLSVPGAAVGDVVNVSANTGAVNPASIIITAYVTSANTVTLQAYNASNSAVTLSSDTYKVKVIK
jgi:hypothetical protein